MGINWVLPQDAVIVCSVGYGGIGRTDGQIYIRLSRLSVHWLWLCTQHNTHAFSVYNYVYSGQDDRLEQWPSIFASYSSKKKYTHTFSNLTVKSTKNSTREEKDKNREVKEVWMWSDWAYRKVGKTEIEGCVCGSDLAVEGSVCPSPRCWGRAERLPPSSLEWTRSEALRSAPHPDSCGWDKHTQNIQYILDFTSKQGVKNC